MHDPDDNEQQALERAFPALAELRAQGVIGAIGAGINQWQMQDRFAAELRCGLLSAGRALHAAGADRAGISGPLPGARDRHLSGRSIQQRHPGRWARGPARPTTTPRRRPRSWSACGQIEAICARYDVPLHRAAAQFALAHPAVTAVVLGAVITGRGAGQPRCAVRTIPPELWADLRGVGLLREDAPVPA